MANAFGAHVIGVDVSDEKLDLAKECGADEVINVSGEEMAKEVMKITADGGVDAVVDMVSTKQTIEEGDKSLGRGGTLVLVAVPRGFSAFDINDSRFIFDEIVITGCRCATRQEIKESLELVRRGIESGTIYNSMSQLLDFL